MFLVSVVSLIVDEGASSLTTEAKLGRRRRRLDDSGSRRAVGPTKRSEPQSLVTAQPPCV